MKTILRIAKYAAISIYAICGIMLVVFLVPKTGWKALNVATGSMTPAIPQGSLVIIHRVNVHSLRAGDVVTYINPRNTKETITHRITEVTHDGSILAFITKGDANNVPDKQILGGNVVGKVVFHAPKLGRILGWAKRPLGLILLVIIPGLLIIIDEIRRMVKTLSEPRSAPPIPIKEPATVSQPMQAKAPPGAAKPKSKRRGMDGLIRAVLVIGLVSFVIGGATKASLKSSASLIGNTIATAPVNTSHIVIARVFIGGNGSGGSVCPELPGSASIIDSNGFNSIIISSHCRVVVHNHNDVTVDNSNSQSSSSGSADNSGNTTGGSATSGDAGNSNSTTTTIDIGNGGVGQQWVELYNPTNANTNVTNWTLDDNSTVVDKIPARILRPHHAVFIRAARFGGKFGDGLDPNGDRLVLKNKLGAVIDALSWGSDTTVFNPALPAIPAGSVAERIDPGFDSDTAGDWQVVSP